MSSIIDRTKITALSQFGIAKYHTRVKIVIHSHKADEEGDVLDVSDDCDTCSLSKNIKGAGQANFNLLPSINYLNKILPNDYVNIYFDIGDGLGWTRTFFGMVDRVEESYGVGDDGTPNTSYAVMCTDFSKVVTRTEIYFNPQISQRRDLNGLPYGTLNVGGLALMTSGIAVKGSPDTIVTVNLILTLGFGSQFMMPKSYPVSDAIVKQARIDRTRAAYRLIQNKISPSTYNTEKARIEKDAAVEAQRLVANSGQEDIARTLATRYHLNVDNLDLQRIKRTNDQDALTALISDQELRKLLGVNQSIGTEYDSFIAIDRTANPNQRPTLLDYIDMFTFVEREAIDGYTSSTTIWQQQGPIQSFLTSYSNEIVNEMFFDLRPRHTSDLGANAYTLDNNVAFSEVATDSWDTSSDEIKGNTAGTHPNCSDGIRYVPALVMREYPFSTISDLDASRVPISISTRQNNQPTATAQNAENAANNVETVGNIFLGAVFSDKPNQPGRHYISTPNINVEDIASGTGPSIGRRILDVAVISEKEIRSSKLSRSDEDHVNLIEMWSDSVLGDSAKWYMQDLSPIITPIHIMKNGLRRRTLSTVFARYDRSAVQNTAPTPQQQQAAQQEQQVMQAPDQGPTLPANSIIWPAVTESRRRYINGNEGMYGYRRRSNTKNYWFNEAGFLVPEGTVGAVKPTSFWKFHHGVDIGAPAGTPVVAAMDGDVVVVAVVGMYGEMGNVVVIKHTTPKEGYTVYMHLQTISDYLLAPVQAKLTQNNVPLNNKAALRRVLRFAQAHEYNRGGTMASIRVIAGQQIGTVGGTRDIGTSFGPHLHFEFTTAFPSNYPLDSQDFTHTNQAPILSGDIPSGDPRWSAPLTNSSVRSRDPTAATTLNIRSAPHKLSLHDTTQAPANGTGGTDSDTSLGNGDASTNTAQLGNPTTAQNPDGTQSNNPNIQNGQIPNQDNEIFPSFRPQGQVMDSINSRRQLARWLILQDHWYQHNLEYLSGSFEISPHPEIRVGYRLDILERNMSFYVEGVAHQWKANEGMSTSLTVTRGQPNNPFPVYVHPATDGFVPAQNQRKTGSRLGEFFITPDPVAIRNSLVIRESPEFTQGGVSFTAPLSAATNETDTAEHLQTVNQGEVYTSSQIDYVYNPSMDELVRRVIDGSLQNGRGGGVADQSTGTPQGSVPTASPTGGTP